MTEPRTPNRLPRGLDAFARRLEFGDALVLLYLVAFAREFFWIVKNQPLAWSLTTLVAVAAWLFYVGTRRAGGPTPRAFWLIVALPLGFIYLLRAPIPDPSFDVLNYHLLHSERALRGVPFLPGDFFPTPLPNNPAPDLVTGVARHLLGYRLGTIVNLLALVWAAVVVEKILRQFVRGPRLRSACVLLVMMSEHALFEINEYMIDLLALPLVLEALRLTLFAGEETTAGARGDEDARRARADAVRVAFLLGAAAALKLTTLSAALALAPFFARRFVFAGRPGPRPLAATLALASVVFVLPLLPFSAYMLAKTGNPVFPFYNAVFKSPYWPPQNYRDPRWGPTAVWEIPAWPAVVNFAPGRTTELKVYSGRVGLGCAAALLLLLLLARRRDATGDARDLCVVFLIDALLWSATTGYIRYSLELDLLGGTLLVALAARLAASAKGHPASARRVPAYFVAAVLCAQSALAFYYTLFYEWGMRPIPAVSSRTFFREAKYVGHDRSLSDFLSAGDRARFAAVGTWVWSGVKTPGLEALLRPDLPVIGVRGSEYFSSEQSRAEFARQVERASATRMASLCFAEDCDAARAALAERDLRVVSETQLELPFFSDYHRVRVSLLEVEPARP